MRKKGVIFFLVLFCMVSSGYASSEMVIPDEFYIQQHYISYTTSFDIKTKSQKLGTLYRRLVSLVLTYDFYNTENEKVASARSKFFSFNAQFDIRDAHNQMLGRADEKFFSYYPSFVIYGRDVSKKLAIATMNFWNTEFSIYDPVTNEKMAVLSRPFLRYKNNWTVHITNPTLFHAKEIDPRVLLTVLAFQGDREDWEDQKKKRRSINEASPTALSDDASERDVTMEKSALLVSLDALVQEQDLSISENSIPPDVLESITNELEAGYEAIAGNNENMLSSYERLQRFAEYCFSEIRSTKTPVLKKQAIVLLLRMRLQSMLEN